MPVTTPSAVAPPGPGRVLSPLTRSGESLRLTGREPNRSQQLAQHDPTLTGLRHRRMHPRPGLGIHGQALIGHHGLQAGHRVELTARCGQRSAFGRVQVVDAGHLVPELGARGT